MPSDPLDWIGDPDQLTPDKLPRVLQALSQVGISIDFDPLTFGVKVSGLPSGAAQSFADYDGASDLRIIDGGNSFTLVPTTSPSPPPPDPDSPPALLPMPPKKYSTTDSDTELPRLTEIDGSDSDDDMPALTSIPTKSKPAASTAKPSTPKPATATAKPAAPKPKPKSPAPPSGYDEDDDSDDMPPLTDAPGISSASAGGGASKKPSKEVREIREVEYAKGTVESKLFDFEGFKGTKGAFELLQWDVNMTDADLVKKAEELMANERSSERNGKSTSTRLGALLVIVCSRLSCLPSFANANSMTRSLSNVFRTLYLSEANLHLQPIKLPLPPGAFNPSDVDLRLDSAALAHLDAEKTAHEATKKRLRDAQLQNGKATSGSATARTKSAQVEAEVKSLRAEVSKLKTEKEEQKVSGKEGWAKKDEISEAFEQFKIEAERNEKRWKREAKDAQDEADRLRREASRRPSLPSVAIPSGVSSDKKDFVIQRLSQQVQTLNRQLRDKNSEYFSLLSSMGEIAE